MFAALIIIGFIPLARLLNSMVEAGRFDEGAGRVWLIWIVSIVCGVLALSFLGMLILPATRWLKRPGVPCPDCGRPLFGPSGRVASATGRCIYCDGKVFEELPGEESAHLT